LQATDVKAPESKRTAPPWVAWTLVVGAVLLLLWAWFIFGFLSEPSAVGRPRLVLDWLVGSSIGAAAAGAMAAIGLLRHKAWAWGAGVFASAVMILTCAGAVVGIPALVGLISSRRSS
jgi:hypothetical protein